MAESTTLARPYARAAFEYADAHSNMDAWSKALQQLAAIVAHEKVAGLLADPLAVTGHISGAVIDLMGDELDQKMQNFVSTLAANKRLGLLAEISLLFDLMKANREQVLDVRIHSAYDMDAEQRNRLADALGSSLKRTILLEVETDRSLIGGALINAGDTLIDGSVKGRLTKLADFVTQ